MKWIGQHIYDLISRFRDDVYLEDLSTTTETNVLVVDSNGKVSKSTTLGADIEASIETAIDTLPNLTSFGSAGATTNIAAGDLTMYDAAGTEANPTISLGSSATDRLEIKAVYNSASDTLCDIDFTTYTASGTNNDGRYNFYVDEVLKLVINDDSLVAYTNILASDADAQASVTDTTTSSATQGGKLRLRANDGAAMGDDHRLGVIEFVGAEDSSSTYSIGARIQAIARDAWGGSDNDADLEFYTTDGTTESKVLTLDADKLATFAGDLTVNGDSTYFTSANSADPLVIIKNTTNDEFGGRLRFLNARGADGQDDDEAGIIQFYSYDDGTPSGEEYAAIKATIHDATAGEESGRLQLQVASHDGGTEDGLVLTGGSVDAEVDVTIGNGAASVVTIPGNIDLAGKMVNRVSQIVNLKGYATLQDDVYDFANAFPTDDEAPFQLDVSYGSGTIGSGTEVNQGTLFRAGGFHVPFACTVSALQTQITCNNAGNVSIALVEYRPSDLGADQTDYPRTVYETVVNASDNSNNKVDTVTIAAGDLDNTAVPAGSHLMIMVKGDGTSAGGTLVVSVAVGLSW